MNTILFWSIVTSLTSGATIVFCMLTGKPKKDCAIDIDIVQFSSVLHKVHNALFPNDHIAFVLNKKQNRIDITTSTENSSSLSYYIQPAMGDLFFIEKTTMYDNVWANLVKCIFLMKQEDPNEGDVYSIFDIQNRLQSECGIDDICRYLHMDETQLHNTHIYMKECGDVVISRIDNEPWVNTIITPRNECYSRYRVSHQIGYSQVLEEFSWFLKSKFD